MQKLGHNHVITSAALTGTIQMREPAAASSFELSLPLESLVVDDDAARARAGADFSAPVPEKDREGTRRNMLGDKVLNAALQPELRLASESVSGEAGQYGRRCVSRSRAASASSPRRSPSRSRATISRRGPSFT
jgi:hypothetical protein